MTWNWSYASSSVCHYNVGSFLVVAAENGKSWQGNIFPNLRMWLFFRILKQHLCNFFFFFYFKQQLQNPVDGRVSCNQHPSLGQFLHNVALNDQVEWITLHELDRGNTCEKSVKLKDGENGRIKMGILTSAYGFVLGTESWTSEPPGSTPTPILSSTSTALYRRSIF